MLGKTASARNAQGPRPTDLGAKLRRLRKKTGLGVVEAAKRSKISAGFLSAIELSRANPSVATLQRLTSTYGSTVLDFFDVPKQSNHLVRPRDRRAIQTQSGVRIELLSVGARQLESQLFRVAPGAGSDGSYSHQGEEFIYMMSGTLEIWLDELQCHTLQQGDSFWFESTVGHRWFNPSSDDFERNRLAMDGVFADGSVGLAPRSRGQGFNSILRTTHRQNFLVPPRRHRSFPLAEL